MKFLCIVCDTAMKLEKAEPPVDGSLTAIFECPDCFHQIAMLTNPMETQAVTSLGISIGPKAAAGADGGSAAERAAAGGCPFSGMVAQMEQQQVADEGIAWTTGALERLANIPEFIRPMAKQGVEQFAESNGYPEVSEEVMDEARGRFGML